MAGKGEGAHGRPFRARARPYTRAGKWTSRFWPKRARLTCRSSSRWQLCGHLPSYSARHMTPPELSPPSRTPVVLLALPNRSACAGDDAALLEGFLSLFARRAGCESMERRAFKLARAAPSVQYWRPGSGLAYSHVGIRSRSEAWAVNGKHGLVRRCFSSSSASAEFIDESADPSSLVAWTCGELFAQLQAAGGHLGARVASNSILCVVLS